MIEKLAECIGVTANEILGISRKQEIAIARELYWKFLREISGYTFSNIGRIFDRDHSTIISGIAHVNDLLSTGDQFTCKTWKILCTFSPVFYLKGSRTDLSKRQRKIRHKYDYCNRF